MNKKHKLLLGGLALVCAAAIGGYCYFNVNMTGKPYEEIQSFRESNPNRTVHYTVTLEGDSDVTVKDDAAAVQVTTSHTGSLLTQADYLQSLTSIDFGEDTLTAEQMNDLTAAYPNAAVSCKGITALGETYDYHTTSVNLAHITPDMIPEAAALLQALPELELVDLTQGDALSPLSLEDAHALYTLYPHTRYNYCIELFGQVLSTDMERVEYFKVNIGDEGLEQFKLLLPMMHALDYFKLDWCKTSDEAMDALRTQYKDEFKVVWRVFFGYSYNALTDTYKLWANRGLNDENIKSVKYCNEVRYLDFGHSGITHCEWVRFMPELQVCILSDSKLKSIEPVADCHNLEFLEFFFTYVNDLSPVSQLQSLHYLNFSRGINPVTDITPLYGLNNLKIVHAALTVSVPKEQRDKFRELHPDTRFYYSSGGDSTGQQWRKFRTGHLTPRYKLLREQIGYDTEDVSKYPTGYLDHEITYESTGITPPELYVVPE